LACWVGELTAAWQALDVEMASWLDAGMESL
jgi:hypothetical protein